MPEIDYRPVGLFRLDVKKHDDKKWVATIKFRTDVLFRVVKTTEKAARYAVASWVARQQRALEKAGIRLDSEYATIDFGHRNG